MNVPLVSNVAPASATWKDYITLTKPRVISLLLFTTLAAMFVAPQTAEHHVTLWLFVAVAIGGYMAAGAANTINMVYDRDIDVRMRRTACRPTVTLLIPTKNAMFFALVMATGATALLWSVANIITAVLAMAGLAFYIVIYTMLLKRRTWHNIVIGGAAGAFPPLVGWTAVTGSLSAFAWLLFAIVFVWTPVHFWALAMLIKDDYTAAGIPMLPSVKGDRATVIQIAMYTVLTIALTITPCFYHTTGYIYFVSAVPLNIALTYYSVRLYQNQEKNRASALFHYSMVYLAALFLMMAIDRVLLH